MDPLSSLRFAVSPELRAARLPQAGDGVGRGANIGADLEKLGGLQQAQPAQNVKTSPASFENTLGKMVQEVSGSKAAADEAVTGMLSGQDVSLHQAMIAMEEANVSFQLMVEVRNKLLESYQELMRMQV